MQSYIKTEYICNMDREVFQFKKFSVAHGNSSMKIGVDAVLLGAWASKDQKPKAVLDVGTGCGVIALILAQRFRGTIVIGVDIDEKSIEEATYNFNNSPYYGRLKALQLDFPTNIELLKGKFNLIVSNPPYFNSGVKNPSTPREKARHQGSLSVFSLLEHVPKLLESRGRLAVIIPTEQFSEALLKAKENGMCLQRCCFIRNREPLKEKRVMMEFGRSCISEAEVTHLTLFEYGLPTEEYRDLCREFYMKF